jgi:lysophospholipase L1-like esterase
MRTRGAVLAVPAVAGGLWVQVRRAARAPLPEFDDLDPTGFYGAGSTGGEPVRVATIGDSTLTGPGLDHAREVFVSRVAAGSPHRLHLQRYAVGGSRIADVLMGQLPAVLDARPEAVVISVGANDVMHGTPLPQFERDLRAVVGALDLARIPALLCGLIDLAAIPRVPAALRPLLARRGVAYERRKARIAARARQVEYVSVDRATSDAFRADPDGYFVADRFHPSGVGHASLARAFAPRFRALVDEVVGRREVVPAG